MPQPVAFVTGASTGIGFATAKKLRGRFEAAILLPN